MTEPPGDAMSSDVLPMANAAPRSRLLSRKWVQYALAVGVVYLLWHFDRLRWDDLKSLEFRPGWALFALLMLLPNYVVAAFRLQCVLLGMGAACTFRQAWMSTIYGAVGELSLPVFAGGDIVKAVHVGSAFNRSTAAASVTADRLIGLVGLVLFGALACAVQLPAVMADGRLQSVAIWLSAAAVGIAMASLVLAFGRSRIAMLLRRLSLRLPAGESLMRLASRFGDLAKTPQLYFSLGLSAAGHLLWCCSALGLAFALSIDVPVWSAMLVLPLVAACNLLSFAGGIGGGTVAFEYLFHHILGTPPGAGAQVGLAMPLLVNFSKLFALPWLLRTAKPHSTSAPANELKRAA
jgi:hypothetical protein